MCFLCAALEWPAIPSLPPALGKYSGQAVANTLLTVVSPWLLRGTEGGEERKKERERETCLSAKMRDKGSSGFCTGTSPKAFPQRFN